MTAGLIPPSAAISVLNLAGTSPSYRGLYQAASHARPVDTALLDELEVEFQETVRVPPLAELMAALEHTHDRMCMIAEVGWQSPADHPDLEPAHQALLLREHFTEMLRTDEVQQQSVEFRQYVHDSEAAAREPERELSSRKTAQPEVAPPETLRRLAERISTNCRACHQKFRDPPLAER